MQDLKIAIAGEIYSANLGDGVVFEAVQYLLKRLHPQATVVPCDISLRHGWPEDHGSHQRTTRILQTEGVGKPLMLAHHLASWRKRLVIFQDRFAGTHGIVVGGGQLLRDRIWSFPMKLHAISRAARAVNIPMHVFCCGVGPSWSRLGGRLFRRFLTQARSVSVRDHLSHDRLCRMAPGISCQQAADPALWAHEVFGPLDGQTVSHEQRIGLGIMAPESMWSRDCPPTSTKSWLEIWLSILRALAAENLNCELFTNGNTEDFIFAARLHEKAQTAELPCSLVARPHTPKELVSTIRGYRAVFAGRLHASVIATAYNIPAVGYLWDDKVKGFYVSLGHEDRCLNSVTPDPRTVVQTLLRALDDGVNTEKIEQLKQQTLLNMQVVLQRCLE